MIRFDLIVQFLFFPKPPIVVVSLTHFRPSKEMMNERFSFALYARNFTFTVQYRKGSYNTLLVQYSTVRYCTVKGKKSSQNFKFFHLHKNNTGICFSTHTFFFFLICFCTQYIHTYLRTYSLLKSSDL